MAAADVVVRFIGDSSNLNSEIAKVERSTTGLGDTFKTMAKTAVTAFGAVAVGAFAKDAINAAADYADQVDAVRVVFGKSSKAIDAWADNASTNMGLAKTDALKAALAFSASGKALGLMGDELSAFAQMTTQRAADVASLFGGTAAQAVEAFGSALRGEFDPIEKYGVFINEAAISAEALSLGLVKATGDADKIKAAQLGVTEAQIAYTKAVKDHGAESEEAHIASTKLELAQGRVAAAVDGTVPPLTEAQKKTAAYQLIMDQTAIASGNFADTSDSAANKMKIMKAKIDDAEVALGTALLPIVEIITPKIAAMSDAFANAAPNIKNATVALGAFAAVAVLVGGPVGLIIFALGYLTAAVILAWTEWNHLLDRFSNNPVIEAVLTVLLSLVAGVVAVVGGISFLWHEWDRIWAELENTINSFWNRVQSSLDLMVSRFRALPGAIGDALSGLGDTIAAPFVWAWGIIQGIADDISGALTGALNSVKGAWNSFAHGFNGIEIHVPGVKIPFAPDIPGFTIGLPNLPMLAAGGIVTGPTLALLGESGREAVIPLDRGGLANTYNITVNVPPGAHAAQVGAATVDAIRAYERINGRSWRQ